MRAAPGRVKIHAYRILAVTPQRTAEKRLIAPTPMTDEVIVWVVLTGSPMCAVARSTAAAPVSAANPCTGSNFTIPMPSVRTIFHPPTVVPNPIASAHSVITQPGTSASSGYAIDCRNP